MPLQATSGAASYDAFGGGVPVVPAYIEEVFSCFLYTGNGSTQTITNGIDLSTKGGLLWMKSRSEAAGHMLYDTASNATLRSDSTSADSGYYPTYINPTSSGFFLDASAGGGFNTNAVTYASWTFRKQPKFFDVVTYTGNGTNGRTVAHSLGSVPGCMIVKRTDASNGWAVYHRSMNASPQDYMMRLNATTEAFTTSPSRWNNTLPTSTEFTLSGSDEVNGSGATYVAYLFAHNAGGFGLTGTDNVISCGSYTGNGSATGPVVTLGYEPQWVMVKRATVSTGSWEIYDSMRGFTMEADAVLRADTSGAEFSLQRINPTSTGFQLADSDGDVNANGSTYIYIAIRRGPMKVPTDATKVFTPQTRTGTGSADTITGVGFPVDLVIDKPRNADTGSFEDRLRGSTQNLVPSSTGAETTSNSTWDVTSFASMDGISVGISGNVNINTSGTATVNWFFRRAPSFFDEVCYTGTGVARTVTHNLGVAPELMIVKSRGTNDWAVYNSTSGATQAMYLNSTTAAFTLSTFWNDTAPTSTVFTVGTRSQTNEGAINFVAYLFATCAGVSKVGSYTGTATTKQIDCGFTGGARFVLIKRTDSTGDWYVWDTARGIVSGNDPYLLLNSTAAEVTNTDYIDTYSAGFEISSTAPAAINASGGTYIFLAIA
jgi:hypothetical protein